MISRSGYPERRGSKCRLAAMGIEAPYPWGVEMARLIGSREFSHSLPASLGSLGLLLLSLNARFIVESPFLDFREKTFFGQFFLEISYGLFYLVVVNNNFHNKITSSFKKNLPGSNCGVSKRKKGIPCSCEMPSRT